MGRHAKTLTDAQKAEFETLAAVLATDQIADFFGIGRTTFWSMMQRDEAIAERYKKAQARAIGAIAQGLIAKARGGDTTSMIFYLKTQGGWRETTAVELSVPEAGNVQPDAAFLKLSRLLDETAARLSAAALGGRPAGGAASLTIEGQAVAATRP